MIGSKGKPGTPAWDNLSPAQRALLRTIRAVGIDVDQTLLTSAHEISPENREAILEAQHAGLGVHLITGRSLQTLQPVLDAGLFTDLMAVYGGAYLFDPIHAEVIDRKLIPRAAAEILVQTARAGRAAIFMYFSEGIYLEAVPELLEGFHAATSYWPVETDDILRDTAGDPSKIAVFGKYEQLNTIVDQGRQAGADLFYAFAHDYFVDVTHKEAGKGSALKRLCSNIGILPQEMLVIGDGENDLPMFEAAGFGVAVANAAPSLLAAADLVTGSNDEHGVAQVLRTLLDLKSAREE